MFLSCLYNFCLKLFILCVIYFYFLFNSTLWCDVNVMIIVGILPKRKDGSETILTKLQSVIEGFDSKSNDKGIVVLLSYII